MKILIVEDEPAAAAKLKSMIEKIAPDAIILETLDSVAGAIRWFGTHSAPDLIFLDIQLGDGLSFEIFSQVKLESFVIFTTAFDAYALRAFELNSIEYLLKPIQPERLEVAINKFRKLGQKRSSAELEGLLARFLDQNKPYKQRFLVSVADKIRSISVGQIAYFYSFEKDSFFCTTEGLHLPLDLSLDAAQEQLDPTMFFRINRQYLISFQAIAKLHVMPKSRIAIALKPPSSEMQWVSAARTADFRKWLDM